MGLCQPVQAIPHGTGPLQITAVKTTGDFAQNNACGAPVQPNSSCIVQVTFTPTAQGPRTGSLILTDNALDSPQTIPLTGFGGQAPVVSLSTNALFFSQNVGSTSASQPVVVTNIGNAPLNVAHITVAGDFSQSNNCGTVPAGGNCTLQVSFSPTAAGLRTGGVTISDDSLTSPEAVSLSGIGSDFSLPPPSSPGTATINAGQTATYTLTVSPVAESSTTVSFSCSALPPHSSCSISPPSTTVSGSPQNFTVSVSTTASSAVTSLPQTDRRWPTLWLAHSAWLCVSSWCSNANRFDG